MALQLLAIMEFPSISVTPTFHSFFFLFLFFQHGADVNAMGLNNDTALHDACENGHPDIVKVLMLNGADLKITNNDGKTALDVTEDDDIRKLIEGETSHS